MAEGGGGSSWRLAPGQHVQHSEARVPAPIVDSARGSPKYDQQSFTRALVTNRASQAGLSVTTRGLPRVDGRRCDYRA